MSNLYGTVITSAGAGILASCILEGKKLNITQAAVGDGGGAYYLPNIDQSGLVNEQWRGGIAAAEQSAVNPNMIDIKIVIPDDAGGFVVREAALYSEDGTCIAIGNMPASEKRPSSDGVSGKLTITVHLVVTDASAVEVIVSPNLNTVSQEQMLAAISAHDNAGQAHPVLREQIEAAQKAAKAAAPYHLIFEESDWDGGELRVPEEAHGIEVKREICICTVRFRKGRNVREYLDGDQAALARTAILAAVTEALNANASAAGTYPTAEDGHVQLTWEQVQYYLLEGQLVPAEEAAEKAAEKGFDWKDRDITGVPETAALDGVLAAAYLPALGGVSAAFDALCTVEVLQGLRLRRKDIQGEVARYDLDGEFYTNVWCVLETAVNWDLNTGDLVLKCGTPYAGDLLVLG